MIMSALLVIAIVSMFSALAFYSIGVWSEKLSGLLKVWHTVLFWMGLVFDTTGTTIMGQMAGKFEFNLHGITGALAIVLMMGHAVWAVLALASKKEAVLQNFHKFSLFVWVIWLIPFLSGMAGAMLK
jgi:uncharacterized repeat protein (TIGR03987 family)